MVFEVLWSLRYANQSSSVTGGENYEGKDGLIRCLFRPRRFSRHFTMCAYLLLPPWLKMSSGHKSKFQLLHNDGPIYLWSVPLGTHRNSCRNNLNSKMGRMGQRHPMDLHLPLGRLSNCSWRDGRTSWSALRSKRSKCCSIT